jgi:ABC-2 type transport system permease protein
VIALIARKELRALFGSPLAWFVLAAIQCIFGYGFLKRLDDFLQIQSQLTQLNNPPGVTELVAAPTFATAAALMLFATPVLAMRFIAEERRQHSLLLLLSAPVSLTEIVIGKFLGLTGFLSVIVLLVGAMPLALADTATIDYGLLAMLLLALLLLTASFAAVGLYASSLTAQPVAAALAGFGILITMIFMGETAADSLRSRGWMTASALAQTLSPMKNFEPLARGVADSYAISCSVLLTAVFLVLTIRRMDAMRLRG